MTETEAKKKWCPFARYVVLGPKQSDLPAHNRVNTLKSASEDGVLCIGSACMAWRVRTVSTHPDEDDTGYCGLAGRP